MSNIASLVGGFTVDTDITPDQGLGTLGEWPPHGDHEMIVTGLSVSEDPFKMDGNEYPGWSAQFEYLWNAPHLEEPLSWQGRPFNFPKDRGIIKADNQKQRIRIAEERLAGHIKTLLGRAPGNYAADLGEIDAMINGPGAIICSVFVKNKEKMTSDGPRKDREEKLQKLISS